MNGVMPRGRIAPLGGQIAVCRAKVDRKPLGWQTSGMKKQIKNRLCAPLIHDVLGRLCDGALDAGNAAERLGVSRSHIYGLRTEYLRAKAAGELQGWMPGLSGGDHAPGFSEGVCGFLRCALPQGYSYAFAASEVRRCLGSEATRASVRRWAIAEGLADTPRPARTPAHTRRWQRLNIGEVWQLDATPHHWFGKGFPAQPLLDMIDDASRLQVGIRLCHTENIVEYVHFLRGSFESHGLPMALYVDNAAFFRSPKDGVLTALGARLAFYGVSLLFASTPQSKGKIERIHQVWQDRLPPFLGLNGFTPESNLVQVNAAIMPLATYRNVNETHREIGMPPQEAWDSALKDGRSKLRPVPRDGWWPYVWSPWRNVTVGDRGRVFYKDVSMPTQLHSGEKAILCEHESGHYSIIKSLPRDPAIHPVILFTNLPQDSH